MSNAFSNTSIQGIQIGKIRRLSGFRKNHQVPKDHFEAASEFVKKIGSEEVRKIAETVHSSLRSVFGFKRREMEYVCEEGVAAIKTPLFEVNITISQDELDAANYALKTEVANFESSGDLLESSFCDIFNSYCDRIVIDFQSNLRLEDKIDTIEENEKLEPFLDYAADCSSFTLTFQNPNIKFHASAHAMEITLPGTKNLRQLISHCESAFEVFSEAGVDVLGG